MDFLKILLMAAFPMAALAYLLFTWSIRSGRLTKTDTHKSLQAELKGLKTSLKEKKTAKSRNPIHNKWMKFGGGFYGLVGLWTFMIIELAEVFEFFMNFTSFMDMMQRMSIDLVIDFFINSLMNFVAAIAWPAYWTANIESGNVWLWFAAAYGGYWAGMQLARRKGQRERQAEESA